MFFEHHIANCTTGELLYVGSKTLDEDRRYALTWTGIPNNDPAFHWKIISKPKNSYVYIENKQTGELLYVGSKMLDDSRRHALTWRGSPNNDPAMRWKLIDVGDCKFMIENNNMEILCTGDDLLDPDRRRVYTVKRKGEEYKTHAHLWHLKDVTLKH